VPHQGLTIELRRALQILAKAQNGMTESSLRRGGFSPMLLVGLVVAGYAVTKPQTMRAAGKTFGIVRFAITDAGRRAIEQV
jgi:hypothetical protein